MYIVPPYVWDASVYFPLTGHLDASENEGSNKLYYLKNGSRKCMGLSFNGILSIYFEFITFLVIF